MNNFDRSPELIKKVYWSNGYSDRIMGFYKKFVRESKIGVPSNIGTFRV